MRNRDYRHIGRMFSRTVRDAVRYGGVEDIGQAVENGVQELTDSLNATFDSLRNAGRRPVYRYGQNRQDVSRGAPSCRAPGVRSAFSSRIPGRVSGLVCFIVGASTGIPLAAADIGVFAAGAAGSVVFANAAVAVGVLTPLAAAALWVMGWGISRRRRARRFARYRDAMGGAVFSTVAKLAEAAGVTENRARKDLRQMIAVGACPQGHLDSRETCFMVDDETYEDYLEAEKAYAARTRAAQEEQKKREDPKAAELEAVKKEGAECVRQIHAANDALPEQEISDKLDRLENVTARIFACVEQHPEKLPDIRTFMRYYLPTTMKLVNSYREFDAQPVQGENIKTAKQEIEQALDTVNAAFANLLDSLFADDAVDVSADISTLKTMLKQGGLTGSDFAEKPGGGSGLS